MRGSAMARKTAQLIYVPLKEGNNQLVQSLLDGSLEDPYIRAIHVHIDKTNDTLHTGPEFFESLETSNTPNSLQTTRRESRRSILFSHPIVDKNGTHPLGWVEIELLSSPYMVIHYQTILITIGITLFCLLIAGLLAIRLFKAINEPLRHIQQVINHLAQGRLESRVNPQKSREFVHLADAINQMAVSLELAQQDLQNHIEQSTQDLRETLETIEIKNIELDIARQEAVEGSRIKSEFLANTSHEIRTPLNGILGFVNLALKTNIDEQQLEYLNTIRDSAQNLLTVINGILDFSKIEAGKLTLDYAPLPLRQTIDETLHILAPDAHEKNLQLITNIDKNIPQNLLGDSLRFKQVLLNLVNNAIKFSEHGNIIVSIATIAQQETRLMLKISVTDQGRGLSAEEKNELFKPFSQADTSTSRIQGGTGLGLAICKGLVERMNGEIGVDSAIDQGSTFWFTARLGIDTKNIDHVSLPKLNKYRVLLCGENPASLEQLHAMIGEWRMEQQSITTIHDIFPVIRKAFDVTPFDLLILDIAPNERKIPPMLLSNLSDHLADEFGCKIIACCTAAHQRLFRSNGHNANTIFINKPIGYDQLFKTICDNLNISLSGSSVPTTTPENAIPPASVLLVDDNPANLQLASELLRGLNTQVVQASNGLQAIEAYKQQLFDVIFMDIQMPGMDGFATTRRIRELETGQRRTPIIALTAHSLSEQKAELLIAGMDDCISKPVSEAQLAHIINRWACLSGKKEVVISDSKTARIKDITPIDTDTETNASVDIHLCLKLANNKPALARDMLKMMLDGLPAEKIAIGNALNNNDDNLLSELIHRLYGSSCYCGVPRLKSISGLLDKLFQAKEFGQAKEAIASLNNAIDDVIAWGINKDLNATFGIQEKL